jgi:hypothetical protein
MSPRLTASMILSSGTSIAFAVDDAVLATIVLGMLLAVVAMLLLLLRPPLLLLLLLLVLAARAVRSAA